MEEGGRRRDWDPEIGVQRLGERGEDGGAEGKKGNLRSEEG